MTWIGVFGASSSSLDASVGVESGREGRVGSSDFSNYREWENGETWVRPGSNQWIRAQVGVFTLPLPLQHAMTERQQGQGRGTWSKRRSAARRGLAQRARLQAQHAAALALELKSVAPWTCRESKTICKKAVDSERERAGSLKLNNL